MTDFRFSRTLLVAAVIAIIAGGGGYAIARSTASSPTLAASTPAAGVAGFSSSSLAQGIGRQAGTAMAGLAPQTVSLAQTRALSDQAPAGASVDKASNTITFTGTSVSFTVVAGAQPQRLTFVSYTAPSATYDPNTAWQQRSAVTVSLREAATEEAGKESVPDELSQKVSG